MAKVAKPYRIKITTDGSVSYFVRYSNGLTHYMNSNELPLSLANLLSEKAAETRFLLEDAQSGTEALSYLRMALVNTKCKTELLT